MTDTQTGGPLRTPRSEIDAPVVPAARRESVGVEVVLFWDKSTSTLWEAAAGGQQWPAPTSRRAIMADVARQVVTHLDGLDSEEAAEQSGGSDEMGGTLTFFFGTTSSKGTDLNPSNFERKLAEQDPHWGGSTHIMEAWNQALDEYDEEFGDRAERDRSVHLCILLTDGELDDMDQFAQALGTAGPHRVFLVLVIGYDEDPDNPRHTRCIRQYTEIASKQQAADPHGKSYIRVISFDSVVNSDEIAQDAVTLIGG